MVWQVTRDGGILNVDVRTIAPGEWEAVLDAVGDATERDSPSQVIFWIDEAPSVVKASMVDSLREQLESRGIKVRIGRGGPV